MALNLVSTVEALIVVLAVPAAGYLTFRMFRHWKPKLQRPLQAVSGSFMLYLAVNWAVLDPSMTRTLLLGLPLGKSPVALLLYTAFATGTVLGAFKPEIDEAISRL